MPTDREVDVLARTVFAEARGDTYAGKLAVAHSIMNRVKADLGGDAKPDWWGEGIIEVCWKPYQYSAWNTKDPNRVPAMSATLESKAFAECMIVALQAAHDLKPDPTCKATHYHTYAISPDWAEGKPYVSIGAHRFYKLA